jgi:putative hydrolase of the HAD superfamily
MIKAVFFDLDNTLYDNSLQVRVAREKALKAMIDSGLPSDIESARKKLSEIVGDKGSNYQNHFNELVKALCPENNIKIVAAGVVAYHDAKKDHLIPYSDAIHTLLNLRERGYQLGIITNGVPVKQWEKIIRLGLKDFFHTVVIAENPGDYKPNTRPYITASSDIDIRVEESLMVGDRLETDILGAKTAGMKTAHLLRPIKTERTNGKTPEADYRISCLNDLLRIL